MKRLIAVSFLALVTLSANANLPNNVTTEPAKRGEYLKSLEYSFPKNDTITKDEVLICIADNVQNNDQQIIKIDTNKTIVVMGSVRTTPSILGVVSVIRYDLKVTINSDKIDMSLYNIRRAMDDDIGNKPETSYSKVGTWKNSGIDKIIPVIDEIPRKINSCIASS